MSRRALTSPGLVASPQAATGAIARAIARRLIMNQHAGPKSSASRGAERLALPAKSACVTAVEFPFALIHKIRLLDFERTNRIGAEFVFQISCQLTQVHIL